MVLLWILGASVAESIVSLIGRSIVFLGEKRLKRLTHYFVSLAVGTLLGAIFLEILPEALRLSAVGTVFLWVLFGFLFFFVLERVLLYYHCHEGTCNVHAAGYLILFGDAVHNFIDGVIIALAFFADLRLGILTSIAVLLHEVPQEIGDFLVLLHSGFTKERALLYNFLVATATIFGAVFTYLAASRLQIELFIGPALGVVAGNFLYIAASDLIPGLHVHREKRITLLYHVLLIVLGILLIKAGEFVLS